MLNKLDAFVANFEPPTKYHAIRLTTLLKRGDVHGAVPDQLGRAGMVCLLLSQSLARQLHSIKVSHLAFEANAL